MINIPSNTKEQYKDFNREIKVYGTLWLANKRLSKNLLDTSNPEINNNNIQWVRDKNKYYFSSSVNFDGGVHWFIPVKAGETFNFTYKRRNSNKIYLYIQERSSAEWTSSNVLRNIVNDGTGTYEYFEIQNDCYLTIAFQNNASVTDVLFEEIMLQKGAIQTSYEEYGVYITDYTNLNLYPGEVDVFSFNINEKADMYYTSVPYNTMTIEVNNENGYFTDYDENSIVDKLNEDCYVELFMQINNGVYYKIMTMWFDKIKYSDYEKAKLSFYSTIAKTKNTTMKDKYSDFAEWVVTPQRMKDYLYNTYKITLVSDSNYMNMTEQYVIFDDLLKENLNDFLLYNCATHFFGRTKEEVLMTTNANDDLSLKTINNNVVETITRDMQLEKPIIKKEDTYKGCKYSYYRETWQFEQTNDNYYKSLTGTLQSTRDILIITDEEYRLSDITINDITYSDNVNVSLGTMNSYYKNGITLIIQGNIGDTYDITINKSNMYKRIKEDLVTWSLGDTTDTSKLLEIKPNTNVQHTHLVFLYIKKPIKSYVELKIMGLPYLEIGDTIKVELDNRNIAMVITEINTNYENGLIQTIKGYELDWFHKVKGVYEGIYDDLNYWGFLYPRTDLYPSQSLYPNQI